MLKAYVNYWKGYGNWIGRATRSEWWWVALWNFIIGMILAIPFIFEMSVDGTMTVLGAILGFILLMYSLSAFVPSISLTVRRLRDAGLPWGLYFLNFVPFIGGLIVFILMQLPTKRDNQNNF